MSSRSVRDGRASQTITDRQELTRPSALRYLGQATDRRQLRRFPDDIRPPDLGLPPVSRGARQSERVARRDVGVDDEDLLIDLPDAQPNRSLRMLPGTEAESPARTESAAGPAVSVSSATPTSAPHTPDRLDEVPAPPFASEPSTVANPFVRRSSDNAAAPAETQRADTPRNDAAASLPTLDDDEDLLHDSEPLLPPNFSSPRPSLIRSLPRVDSTTPPSTDDLPVRVDPGHDAPSPVVPNTTSELPVPSKADAAADSPAQESPAAKNIDAEAASLPSAPGQLSDTERATPNAAEGDDNVDSNSDDKVSAGADTTTSPEPKSAKSSAENCGPDPHAELFAKEMYPSAKTCATCHEKIYREWSVSSHAYASVSPMFIQFEQTINTLARGTIGYFCMRCHAPVATELAASRDTNLLESTPVMREGVTCIACHRVVERYGRVNGERRIETGSIFDPVVGTGHGGALSQVIERKDHYKVKTSPEQKGPGQEIHNNVVQFDHLGTSHFCVSCHQVAVYPGIKLEVVWEQYRASPACKSGIRCQDCHMGAVPGQPAGFESAPVAVINNKPVGENRRHSNHMFVGPGYSIAHPGVFPFHDKADRWTPQEWLEFDWRAGWGTEKFEEQVEDGKLKVAFPTAWDNVDDRYDAREIIDDNQKLLAEKTQQRALLMEGSSKLQGPFFKHPPRVYEPLRFRYELTNLNSGHNLPTGSLGAQPQLWINVVLTGPGNEWIWESGYVDANGDMADLHSLEVAAGRIARDQQLVNLQTKFLITNVKGTDREMYLPINVDFDQLPFIRPNGFPVTTMNHPPFIRMEAHSVPPLGSRAARYEVPADLICKPGKYRLSVRMRSRAEPIYFMRFCGATPEMERAMNENMLDFHQHAFEFTVR